MTLVLVSAYLLIVLGGAVPWYYSSAQYDGGTMPYFLTGLAATGIGILLFVIWFIIFLLRKV